MLVVRVMTAAMLFVTLLPAMIAMGAGVFVFSMLLLISFVRIAVFGTHNNSSLLRPLLLLTLPFLHTLRAFTPFAPAVSEMRGDIPLLLFSQLSFCAPRRGGILPPCFLYLLQRNKPGPVIPASTR